MLPIAERLRTLAERAYKDEEHLRTHPDDADESSISEVALEKIKKSNILS